MLRLLSKILLIAAVHTGCGSGSFQGGSSGSVAPKKSAAKSELKADTVTESAPSCLLSAKGFSVNYLSISGENCVGNTIDPNGADKDDFTVTISGSLIRDGWNFFSDKDQDLNIQYNLGSPGTTTQSVAMQVVDCLGVKQSDFSVNTGSGNGSHTLKARRGDRFNIVASVTSGCYNTRPVYDMLRDKDRAFQIK